MSLPAIQAITDAYERSAADEAEDAYQRGYGKLRLSGLTAIITGASRGLGSVIADHFLFEGANIVICSRDLILTDNTAWGARIASFVQCDIANPSSVNNMFEIAVKNFGRIDILVNNAAALGPLGSIESTDEQEWAHAITTNVVGTAYCIRRAIEVFKPQGSGKIINILGGGVGRPFPQASAYAASKSAIASLTETIATELAGSGIDINGVFPGPMSTRMFNQLIAKGIHKPGEGNTSPHLAADLCAWLASADSNGVSGKTFAARFDHWPGKVRIEAQPL